MSLLSKQKKIYNPTDDNGFEALAGYLRDLAGINLINNPKNQTLMSSRLWKIMEYHQLENYYAYLEFLKNSGPQFIQEFISQMTTNTTNFFREKEHFEFLKSILPELAQHRRKNQIPDNNLRIWCAASSTGQEPYTIAITLQEANLMGLGVGAKILATDIDRNVLEAAASGSYSEDGIKGLPPLLSQKYCKSTGLRNEKKYQINKQLKDMIHFAEFNLKSEFYTFKHPFDVVFCRNVLIYFTQAQSAEIIRKLSMTLRPGGYLMLGHSECGHVKPDFMESIKPSIYKRIKIDSKETKKNSK